MKSLSMLAGALLVLAPPMRASNAEVVPFAATYQGTFTISFVTGALSFNGDGIALHLGNSAVAGNTLLAPDPANPLCFNIVQDAVTLTSADGAEVHLVNAGQDCLDPATGTISGTATTTIVGGTGRFADATGTGTAQVVAQILASIPGGVTGTFVLRFEGEISTPGAGVS